MKTNIFTFFLCLLCITAFTQVNNGYEYRGRFTPVIKQEKIGQAKYLSEIMPEFCRYFSLPYKDHNKFKQRLKIEDMISETYNYSHKYYYHQEKFEKLIDYISVDISATCNGKILSAKSISNVISAEQKNILNTADPGSDISIKIKFKYNYSACEFPEDNDRILEGKYVVTVVPQNEAEYPGGHKQITSYLK